MKKWRNIMVSVLLTVMVGFAAMACGSTAVKGVSLDKSEVSLLVGEEIRLVATVEPEDASDKTVTWVSDKTDVATVNGGTVKAIAVGTAKITITTKDGNKTATATVTVTAPVVEKTVTAITVEAPTKYIYEKGEDIDVAGGKIIVTYSDDSKNEVALTADATSAYDKDKVGAQAVTVTYEGKTASFDVIVYEEIVRINDLVGLKSATGENQKDGQAWMIEDDIDNIDRQIRIKNSITIHGQGHTLSFLDIDIATHETSLAGVVVNSDNVVIKNLNIYRNYTAKFSRSVHALQVFDVKNVVLEDLTLTGGQLGLLVNSSEVTINGLFDVSANVWAGIGVMKGTKPENLGKLTLGANLSLVNKTESKTAPSIYIEDGEGEVINNSVLTEVKKVEKQQTFYFLNADSVNVERTIIFNADTLAQAASSQADGQVWDIISNISDIATQLKIDKAITINGNGKELAFTEAVRGTNKSNVAILVVSDNVVIKDLIITRDKVSTAWGGDYVIQVFKAKDVVLEGVTISGGDAALYVNSSEVTLRGNINVSGNIFGGIEVSKTSGSGAVNAKLTIADGVTFVNADEAEGKPTIWVVGLGAEAQGEVVGGSLTFEEVTKDNGDKQLQYFINA